jgi:DNA-binding HxlR family transcriptional regulator
MGRREYGQSCSLACALDHAGERWSLLIVRELALGPLRFAELARDVGGAPSDVLTKRLRDMERDGTVRRRDLESPAMAVVYELTELGRQLERPMLDLARWGLNFQGVAEIGGLEPSCVPNLVRTILEPPADAAFTVGLRPGDRSYLLRFAAGWIAASSDEAEGADLVLGGEPVDLIAALVLGEAAAGKVEIEGDEEILERLRAMVVLPERLRAEVDALVEVAATARTA